MNAVFLAQDFPKNQIFLQLPVFFCFSFRPLDIEIHIYQGLSYEQVTIRCFTLHFFFSIWFMNRGFSFFHTFFIMSKKYSIQLLLEHESNQSRHPEHFSGLLRG